MESETALGESVRALGATSPADAYFELKRLQDELLEEIPPLKEKIKAELQPPPSRGRRCAAGELARDGARNRSLAGLGERRR